MYDHTSQYSDYSEILCLSLHERSSDLKELGNDPSGRERRSGVEEHCATDRILDVPGGHTISIREFQAGANVECVVHRSEEHTSELQSLTNLVCRLLLEK